MISTSGILSTGEKKCRPMKFSGLADAFARPVIGSVEVFEANTPPGASFGSDSFVTCALRSRFSNTASMIRSQPARSSTLAVAWIRPSGSRLALRFDRIFSV